VASIPQAGFKVQRLKVQGQGGSRLRVREVQGFSPAAGQQKAASQIENETNEHRTLLRRTVSIEPLTSNIE
jgi:hypothetical protein